MINSDTAEQIAFDIVEEIMENVVQEGYRVTAIPYTIEKIKNELDNLINVKKF